MTLEHFQTAYLLITAFAFVVTLFTAERTYGRGVEPGICWEQAFIMAIIWPLFVVLLALIGVKMLTERRP